MIRNQLIEKHVGVDEDFRLRGEDVSRVEAFSDGVFAFAITLTVVSLAVPAAFDQLEQTLLRGLFAFAISFALLAQVWYWHYKFYRRYGLQDGFTVLLNTILLFVVLFYIYPLKFLFTLLTDELSGIDTSHMITQDQWPILMIIYSAGFLAVQIIFGLLYYFAYRKREELELNQLERDKTQSSILSFLVFASIGLASILIAALGKSASLAGLVYLLIAPMLTICHAAVRAYRQGRAKGIAR